MYTSAPAAAGRSARPGPWGPSGHGCGVAVAAVFRGGACARTSQIRRFAGDVRTVATRGKRQIVAPCRANRRRPAGGPQCRACYVAVIMGVWGGAPAPRRMPFCSHFGSIRHQHSRASLAWPGCRDGVEQCRWFRRWFTRARWILRTRGSASCSATSRGFHGPRLPPSAIRCRAIAFTLR